MGGFSRIQDILPRTGTDSWPDQIKTWIQDNFRLAREGIDAGKATAEVLLSDIGTDAVLTEKDLYNYSVKAGLIPEVVGYSIKMRVWGVLANNVNNKILKGYFGGSKIFDSGAIGRGDTFYSFFSVYPVSPGVQKYRALTFFDGVAPMTKTGNITENLKAALAFRFTGTNGTANANDIVVKGREIELNNQQSPSY